MKRDPIVEYALAVLQSQVHEPGTLESPEVARDFLTLLLGARKQEVFVVMFLDAHNRVIATEELFRGTLTRTCVYPREVLREVMRHNAASVILAHNHPAGRLEPSSADRELTRKLQVVLDLIDVAVLDHVIVAGGRALSMAEKGYL